MRKFCPRQQQQQQHLHACVPSLHLLPNMQGNSKAAAQAIAQATAANNSQAVAAAVAQAVAQGNGQVRPSIHAGRC
jgi:hypothetical protein